MCHFFLLNEALDMTLRRDKEGHWVNKIVYWYVESSSFI